MVSIQYSTLSLFTCKNFFVWETYIWNQMDKISEKAEQLKAWSLKRPEQLILEVQERRDSVKFLRWFFFNQWEKQYFGDEAKVWNSYTSREAN